jgi:hypothetical protein
MRIKKSNNFFRPFSSKNAPTHLGVRARLWHQFVIFLSFSIQQKQKQKQNLNNNFPFSRIVLYSFFSIQNVEMLSGLIKKFSKALRTCI